jgi:hypothetical protein
MGVDRSPHERGIPELDALGQLRVRLRYVVVRAVEIDLFLHQQGPETARVTTQLEVPRTGAFQFEIRVI